MIFALQKGGGREKIKLRYVKYYKTSSVVYACQYSTILMPLQKTSSMGVDLVGCHWGERRYWFSAIYYGHGGKQEAPKRRIYD